MNRRNLEILQLSEGASAEDIENAYKRLEEKYREDRFLEGEAGNEAARMLTKIKVARDELLDELAETKSAGTAGEGGAYATVEELIKKGNLEEAQRVLDGFNERGAEWHYMQSVVFYRKNWINESKKQLEIAIKLDSSNQKYNEAYRKLNEKINYDAARTGENRGGVYEGQTMNAPQDDQMGDNFCATCAECCALNLCINCMCNGCCR